MSLIETWLQGIIDRFEKGINRDESVVFYPSYGVNPGEGGDCRIEIRGRITEVRRILRHLPAIALRLAGVSDQRSLAELMGDSANSADSLGLFKQRAQYFVLDGESREQFEVDLPGTSIKTERSDLQGFFRARATVAATEFEEMLRADRDPWISYTALDNDRERVFQGRSQLLGREGCLVVSDIDDTIKKSNVPDLKQLLIKTLFRPFELAPGMPATYRSWSERGAAFLYLTNSPYQLYEPLAEFLGRHYPEGAYYMRHVGADDLQHSIAELLAIDDEVGARESPKKHNLIPILEAFPQRRFILVGDSTEADAEIYADLFLGENFPRGFAPPRNGYADRIKRIYIRDVANSKKRGQAEAALARIGEPGIARFFDDQTPDIEQDGLRVF